MGSTWTSLVGSGNSGIFLLIKNVFIRFYKNDFLKNFLYFMKQLHFSIIQNFLKFSLIFVYFNFCKAIFDFKKTKIQKSKISKILKNFPTRKYQNLGTCSFFRVTMKPPKRFGFRTGRLTTTTKLTKMSSTKKSSIPAPFQEFLSNLLEIFINPWRDNFEVKNAKIVSLHGLSFIEIKFRCS